MTKKKSVIVGMSGGVDSSVAAAILKKRGYRVIGMTMQLLTSAESSNCCNVSDVTDAKQVCHQLGIPHYTLNIKDAFKEKVIDPFVKTYLKGQTPNPCAACNRFIKFTELLTRANALGIDYIATGHYCQKTYPHVSDTYRLKTAKDDKKDQSYFLYMLSQAQLKRVLFPLGRYTKPQIRQLAEKFSLITATKKESQDICFVKNYKTFVQQHSPDAERQPGPIIDQAGQHLGQHTGLYCYTVGQRRGLYLGTDYPLFVLRIDHKTNTLVVGPKSALKQHSLAIHQLSLVNPNEPIKHRRYQLKTRYQMQPVSCYIRDYTTTTATLTLLEATQTAPGQSAVIYDNDRIVGGGIISTQ